MYQIEQTLREKEEVGRRIDEVDESIETIKESNLPDWLYIENRTNRSGHRIKVSATALINALETEKGALEARLKKLDMAIDAMVKALESSGLEER